MKNKLRALKQCGLFLIRWTEKSDYNDLGMIMLVDERTVNCDQGHREFVVNSQREFPRFSETLAGIIRNL